jgi:deoxyribose-phosphate aldolase
VKDYTALAELVKAGATRIGASAGVRIVQESRGATPAGGPSGY